MAQRAAVQEREAFQSELRQDDAGTSARSGTRSDYASGTSRPGISDDQVLDKITGLPTMSIKI